jgi:hypothetical protein
MEVDNGIFRIGNDILNLTKSQRLEVCVILINNMGKTPFQRRRLLKRWNKRGLSYY